jgi:hypothetical protein
MVTRKNIFKREKFNEIKIYGYVLMVVGIMRVYCPCLLE